MIAAAGTVITHAAMMVRKCDRRTSLRRRRSSGAICDAAGRAALDLRSWRSAWYSRKKPTPNTPPTAICVEDTGSPNQLAMITVIAGSTFDEAAAKAWCLENGPAYAHPRRVAVLDDLPLNGAAKIDRLIVQKQARELFGEEIGG